MKSYVSVSFSDDEMREFLELAKKEDIDLRTVIKWCAKEGMKALNGNSKQARLNQPSNFKKANELD